MKLQEDIEEYMWEWLKEYINEYCLVRIPSDEPPLPGKKPGTTYRWQFYMRRGLFNSTFLNYVGCLFWNKFADQYRLKPFQIAGLETGSTPLIVGITTTASLFDINVNSFSIRAERKKYGLLNIFEGMVDSDLPVFIVDDLSNSKDTIKKARSICHEEGLPVLDNVFTIVHKDIEVTKGVAFNSITRKEIDDITYNYLFAMNHFDLSYETYINKKLSEQIN